MALAELSARLANIQVLLLDEDTRTAKLIREILWGIGFRKVQVVHDGSEGLKIMRKAPIDLVITEWQMKPVDGISFVKYLRSASDSPNRYIPIIMLTANVEKEDVQAARDVGITEFVIKPFTSRTLFDRIVLVFESPRSFVMAKDFKGPDRRRREAPAGGEERRKRRAIVGTGADYIPIVAPDFSLKKKIGDDVDIRAILAPEVIAESEAIVLNYQAEFISWVKKEIATLETLYRAMASNPNASHNNRVKLESVAFSIKAQGGTYGYGLASEVAKSLYDFSKNHFNPSEDHMRVMEKHVESLLAIFDVNIKGDGGAVGAEMLDELSKLRLKFAA